MKVGIEERRSKMITQIIKNISKINLIMGLVIVFSLFCLVTVGQAEEGKGKAKDKAVLRTTSVVKAVQGEVTGISDNFIAISYMRDTKQGVEYEMLLPIDDNIRLIHKKSLGQIGVGDRVRVEYEESTEEYKEGAKKERKAKVISFISQAEPKPESDEVLTSY